MTSQGNPWLKRNLTESSDIASSPMGLKGNITKSNDITRLPVA